MKILFLIPCLFIITACSAQRGTLRLITEKDGKVGIGTSNPDELLTVKGKIHTQEVLVDLKGAVAPDYVFEYFFDGTSIQKPDYERLSLVDLELFLKEKRHLPGIPSAKEIEAQGMSLKDMNLRLLEKIEELTLYTLEQQREIEKLKEKISELED